MRARYYISFDESVWTEFFPTNTPLVTYAKEGTEIFFRPKVDKFVIGRTKNNDVFDDLYSRFFDPTYFGVDIYYKINVLGTDKFYFIQPINQTKLNSQNNVFECTPDPDDEYRDILAQYERKWRIWSQTSVFNLNSLFYYPKQKSPAAAFTNISFDTWTEAVAGVVTNWTSLGGGVETARYSIPIATEANDIIYFVTQNWTPDPATDPTIQLVNAVGTARSLAATIISEGIYALTQTVNDTVFVEFQCPAVAATGSFYYQIFYPTSTSSGETVYECIDKCLNYNSVLYPFMGLSYDIVSTFLWNDALPTGHAVDTPNISTYYTANPTNDYVIEAAAQWNDLWLARTDSITTEKNENTEISLKDVMDILKTKLRAYWHIDPDGKVRIEHEKYFRDFAVQADLSSATYTDDKPETDVKVYTYDNSLLANQVNYKETDDHTIGFVSYPVTFDPKQTSNTVRDVNADVTCDIEYVQANPASASQGLMLLKTTTMGVKVFVPVEDMTLAPGYGEGHPNAHLAWDYLCRYYFTYFADAETGYINYALALTTFDHVREFLKQSGIKFRMAADLDWRKPFTVTEGTGWIDSVEYNPETGMYKLDIGLNPYEVEIYVVDSEDVTKHITDDAGADLVV